MSGGLSEEDKARAEQIKNDANQQFKEEKYDKAIELYSKVCCAVWYTITLIL